ncbi:MAG: hypothetical protein J5478_05580 [Bacteroidales bacterium]|nr:hypothetical protein [Bacteroidales bacterium]
MRFICILALGAMAITSCQLEEPVPEQEEGTRVSKVSVAVSAGLDNGAKTKSTVADTLGGKMLKFTAGDRLYVCGDINGTENILSGYLSIDNTSISTDGKHATFTGIYGDGLQAYAWNGTNNQYDVVDYAFLTSDILAACSNVTATLVDQHSTFTVSATDYASKMRGSFATMIAATVDDLMSHSLPVYGFYDNGSFPLSVGDSPSTCTPIFNVNLSGLTADAEYTLVYRNGDDAFHIDETKTLGTITANGSGNAAFACYVSGVTTAEEYHGFLLTNTADGTDVKITALATKALVSKVYNATREVYPANVTLSTMYSTDGNGKKYYAARDGQTLTGNFGGSEGYITIADGATVTLNLEGIQAPHQCDHAPIHCLGDANIILAAGMNTYVVAGLDSNYPSVFVPEGKTLTISGTGELIADAGNRESL